LVPVEAELLEKALSAVVQQHDALRLSFQPEGDSWRGVFLAPAASPGASLLWQVEVADPAEFEALGEKAQRSLDLEHGPLMRAVLAQMADGSQHVLLVIHHLVVDGVSWRVLLEDLQTAYRQLQQGQALVLPAKTSAFKHWAEQLEGYAHSSQMAQEQDFWMAQLQDVSDSLPCDRAQDRDLHCHARTVQSQLSSSLTRQLLQQAPAAYRTQVNDLLLTALARVIARWSGNDSVLIQLEGHGREELFDNVDLTRTLGWFTSLFPVKLTANASPEASIKAVKEQLRAIPNKGLGFGVLRYLGEAPVQQALKALPAPRITFNYLGQFDGSFDNTPSGLFVPSGLGGGANQDPQAPLGNWLTLNGQVYDDVFTLGWTFSLERFDVATVQHLADDYSAELQALIEHCCREENASLTPSDFPLASLDQAQLDQLPLAARDVADLYPLSPMQQGMLFHSLYQQATGDYINQMRLEVSGLDLERFRDAWQATLDAHDILRTGFIWQGSLEQPVQVVFKQVELPFQVMDWRHRSDLAQALEQQDRIERETAFDLARAPLLRLVLIQTGDDSHHLIYTNHHILMDGWSNSQLLGEVLQRYSGHGPAAQLSRYRDYIAWLQGQDQQADQAFWQGQLATFEAPTRLSLALAHLPSASEHEGRSVLHQGFDAQRTRHFAEFAREQKITVNTLVQAAWLLLLQRYTGQATVAFGATVAGRPADLKGIEQQIGLFINTLPIVATPDPVLSVSAWLQQVQSQNLALREHEHTPLFEIQRWAGQGGEALFDNILVFENYPMSEALERGAPEALRFSSVVNHEQTHYPLTLAVALGETLELHYGYGHEYFSAAAVEQISGHFAQLLESLTHAAPHTSLGELAMLGTSERLALLGSPVAVAAVAEEPVHRLIERRVAEAPEAVALLFAGEHLTYGQLNASANYLAERLLEQGVGPDVRVGVAFPRSLEVIVALLAVLKAGGTYVPLDPDYPEERLSYMMADSGMALLLTQQAVLPRLQLPQGLPTLMLDSLAEGSSRNPAPVLDADNLAYVIYTSGSTGQPKGVAVSHGPLAMHCRATALSYEMTAADCELHFLSFAFDGAHERWLTTLSQGGRLLIRDNQLWTARQTYDAIRQHGVTMAGFPPLYLHQLAELAQQDGNPPPVRLYSFGGDAMPRASFELVRQALRPQIMINGYGPTESVVTPLLWKTGPLDTCPTPYAPIGRCEGDRLAYVLGSDLNLLPEGMPGELYLGGTGLARGYLDRPGLSAERFVADPFSNRGARLYRTGDLVRRLADGSLEYLGRLDSQVKIRGFRIEIGEVESRLQQLPEVSEAAVIAHEGPTGQQLSAYVVAADAGLLQAPIEEQLELRNRLKRQLAQTLPEYMVPSGFTLLASLPFTPNGKLDRKALPLPDLAHSGRAYAAPQSELQQRIAAIWQDVLKVERVGLDDHFFELGGHSLLATQVTARMQLEFGANLPLDLLFKADSLTDYVELASPYLNLGSASDLSDLSDFLSELETI
ncbi:amino acid adenylation domain-containing protein, partial [Pseudomonas sp. MAFF 302030]